MFAEIKHHLSELWIRDIDRVKFENTKMLTFGFDNRNNYDEAKELFEMEMANCGEEVIRAFFNDNKQLIQVIEGTEWNIYIDLFNN
jgi:hypothetical protein